jgi:hypothetical protein
MPGHRHSRGLGRLTHDSANDRTWVALRANGQVITRDASGLLQSVFVGGFLADVAVDSVSGCAFVSARSPARIVQVCDTDLDTDADGVSNGVDNCPAVFNPAPIDTD